MSETRPHIVVLDGYTMNPGDLSWEKLKAIGKVSIYDYTAPEQLLERAQSASILLVNKFVLREAALKQLPKLKCICVTATGYNNIDTEAAKQLGIKAFNVNGYSTTAVAQHVFSLMLTLTNGVEKHNQSVQNGDWSKNQHFSYTLFPVHELAGKTLGIYGFGRIGQKVGELALAFDMQVLATHRHPERDARPGVTFVEWEELIKSSDFLSLHAPLQEGNKGIVNEDALRQMKSNAYLINTGRGGLIQEQHLAKALKEKWIAGAALDVLNQEPPPADHPLLGLENCLITPHLAWASVEARERLLEGTLQNIETFLQGKPGNIVA